jgi:hypothetical protein
MKKLFKTSLLVLIVLSWSACVEEDPIEPDIDSREKFIGIWSVQEKIGGQVTGAYQSVVSNDASNTSRITIGNIYNLGAGSSITAIVAGNSLDISSQVVTGITIQGSGLFSGERFTLNYTANDGSGAQTVEAVYSK